MFMQHVLCEKSYSLFSPSLLSLSVCLALNAGFACADDYFEPAFIEVADNKNATVDLSGFSKTGSQAPGSYKSEIYINGNYVDDKNIIYILDDHRLVPILTKHDLVVWGTEANATPEFMALADKADITDIRDAIPDGKVTFDFAQQRLDISIPQEFIRKNAQGYVDPDSWDDGVNMFFVNYGYSGSESWRDGKPGGVNDAYLNLRSGVNLGAWRLRNYSTYTDSPHNRSWNSINTYINRDIRALKSQLVIGESHTPSDIFDSFAFRGAQIYSDDNMRPDSLRGYAPVVRGIAQSNAQVTIRQNGNIIWQSYVSAGPFAINDLYPTSASGDLDVSVREADGTVRQFIQPFSSVPIMQREGQLKYSVTAGEYHSTGGATRTPLFIQSTGTYGMPWSSTLYGGTLLAKHYRAASFGMGKGLGDIGSVSLDSTLAETDIRDETKRGASFRFQYSKDIAPSGTTFTLAGYRYSTSGYYDFDEANGYYARALLADNPPEGYRNNEHLQDDRDVYNQWRYDHNKRSKAQININQALKTFGSLYLSAYEQQYWGIAGKERSLNVGYNTSYSSINYSLNYTYASTPYYNKPDRVLAFAVQVPFDAFMPQSWMNLSGNTSRRDSSSSLGISGNALEDNRLAYNVQQAYTNHDQGANGSVSLDYKASFGEYQVGYNYTKDTHQVNYGAMGGVVAHPYGVTFSQPLGDTLALVKAEGTRRVKVQNNTGVYTDNVGYAIVPYVNPYHRNRISLDIDSLNDKVDVLNNIQTVIPTQGALTVAHYPTVIGYKTMFTLTGTDIPFGASAILRQDDASIPGIVDDKQRVYLGGVPEQGEILIRWDNGHCTAPYHIGQKNTAVINITAICR
ncbi:fimbria/pilus outer membrane usher protein [Rahnella sp. R3(2024)]|uniref:fimbria/pilus outer membrane usher protein n=1 Tax=Rahnella sp. R3(2024) TaxID=3163550 RepID=UPI0036E73B8E